MIIHVVKPGDTVYALSRQYNVPVETIIRDNAIDNPQRLVIGEALVIQDSGKTHTVARGESLYSIARMHNTTVRELLTANPQITEQSMLQPGMVLTIPSQTNKLGTIKVNGFGFPNMNMELLNQTLPYMTYLSVFAYMARPDGTLNSIQDEALIRAALAAKVSPLMTVTNMEEGKGFSSEVARAILTNTGVQDRLLNAIEATMRTKGYRGIVFDFEYIFPENREAYNNFLRKAVERYKPSGFVVMAALAPKTSANQPGLLYEAHDYAAIGAIVDYTILMTYEWGYTYGPPQAVAPLNEVRKVISYAVTAIPPRKILMGIPNYGYDWRLPYQKGNVATSLSNTGAVDLAGRMGAVIKFDEKAQSPFFNYYDAQKREHVVWFEDARSIRAKLLLVNEYKLGGVSYWTVTRPFPQNWVVLSSYFNIEKVM